eukprot:g5497.t1
MDLSTKFLAVNSEDLNALVTGRGFFEEAATLKSGEADKLAASAVEQRELSEADIDDFVAAAEDSKFFLPGRTSSERAVELEVQQQAADSSTVFWKTKTTANLQMFEASEELLFLPPAHVATYSPACLLYSGLRVTVDSVGAVPGVESLKGGKPLRRSATPGAPTRKQRKVPENKVNIKRDRNLEVNKEGPQPGSEAYAEVAAKAIADLQKVREAAEQAAEEAGDQDDPQHDKKMRVARDHAFLIRTMMKWAFAHGICGLAAEGRPNLHTLTCREMFNELHAPQLRADVKFLKDQGQYDKNKRWEVLDALQKLGTTAHYDASKVET